VTHILLVAVSSTSISAATTKDKKMKIIKQRIMPRMGKKKKTTKSKKTKTNKKKKKY